MNIRESKRIMELAMKARVPFLLVGHSGVGKTAIVGDLHKEIYPDYKFITILASQLDVGDFVGIPDSIVDSHGNRTTSWARPEWMPYEPCVLFLDELNNARTDVESALLQLVLEKRINTHKLHPDSFICAAINPATSEYTTANMLSTALIKRFVVLPFQPLADETIKWGEDSGRFHKDIIKFLKHMPVTTGVEKPLETTIKMEPCPRLWEMTSKLLNQIEKDGGDISKDEELLKNLLATSVGIETSALFFSFLESQEKPITFNEIILDQKKAMARFDKIHKEMRGDLISEMNVNIVKGVTDIITKLAPVLSYENPVLDVDAEDKKVAKKAINALNKNVDELFGEYRTKLDNLIAFLSKMPDDSFFKVSYDIITRDPTVKDSTQEEQIKILDAHFSVIMYLYSDNLITKHSNLYKKWVNAAGELEKYQEKKEALSK